MGLGDGGPGVGEEVGGVVGGVFEPGLGITDGFIRIVTEPGGPPTEGAVGDDVVLALRHEVEVEVGGFCGVVVDGMEGDTLGGEVFLCPLGVVGEEEGGGVFELFLELGESLGVVLHGEGAVGLVGVWVGGEVAAADVDGDGARGIADEMGGFQGITVGEGFEGEVLADGFFNVLEIFRGLPVAIKVGGCADVEEGRLEAEGGFLDDAALVKGAFAVEEAVDKGNGVELAVDVEPPFVFGLCVEGVDVEVLEGVFAESAGFVLLGVEVEGQAGLDGYASGHGILEELVAHPSVEFDEDHDCGRWEWGVDVQDGPRGCWYLWVGL